MASPQKENGYTAIANEIYEHIAKCILTGNQRSVLDVVLRMTYGYSRKYAPLSLTYIEKATGIDKHQVSKLVKKLSDMKMISVEPATGVNPQRIAFQKDWEKWECQIRELSKETTVVTDDNPRVVLDDNPTVVTDDNQENNIIKQKKKQTICACAFFESLWNEYPNKKGKARVSKKSMEAINKIGYEEMHRALERYKADKPDWQQWQHGSTFFNSGYLDYLDAAYLEETEQMEKEEEKWQT